jgi:hypothetical protein
MKINEKLSSIQAELKAKKSKFNSFGRYNYRSAEDILEALKPYLVKHNVTVTINESLEQIGDVLVMHSTAIISDGSDKIEASAIVGIDMDQKGMNVPQKFGSASSYGKKYALGNLFLIDDTADSDATNTHGSKPKLEGVALTKAKAFVKNGGSVDAIKAKYNVSDDVLKTL